MTTTTRVATTPTTRATERAVTTVRGGSMCRRSAAAWPLAGSGGATDGAAARDAASEPGAAPAAGPAPGAVLGAVAGAGAGRAGATLASRLATGATRDPAASGPAAAANGTAAGAVAVVGFERLVPATGLPAWADAAMPSATLPRAAMMMCGSWPSAARLVEPTRAPA